MAASPDLRGTGLRAAELDFEAEETAILTATRRTGLSMVVEESGSVDLLGDRLTGVESFDLLHVSCHADVLDDGLARNLQAYGGRQGPALLAESQTGGLDVVPP